MEDTRAGRNGGNAQNLVLVVPGNDNEHARIQDQITVAKIVPNSVQHIKSSDVTSNLVLLMVVTLPGLLGRSARKHVVAARAHAAAHVPNRPQLMAENPAQALELNLSQKAVRQSHVLSMVVSLTGHYGQNAA